MFLSQGAVRCSLLRLSLGIHLVLSVTGYSSTGMHLSFPGVSLVPIREEGSGKISWNSTLTSTVRATDAFMHVAPLIIIFITHVGPATSICSLYSHESY